MSTARGPIARCGDVLRTVVFYLGYSVSVVLYSLGMLLAAPLLEYPQRYRLLMGWNRFAVFWVRVACGVRYRLHGQENLPQRACVIVANHQSAWETIFLATLFPQVCILLKKELLAIPFFGWALRLLRPIAIDRGNPRTALRQLAEQGAARLATGNSVLIFPEGTRSGQGGTTLRFSRGAAQLAINAGVDLVCVAHDAGKCWPAGRFAKTPGLIEVAISPPLASDGISAASLTESAQAWIEARLAEFARNAAHAPGTAGDSSG
jgi:1-acyl-sn-glycerol-3-phosphate acyltransferase